MCGHPSDGCSDEGMTMTAMPAPTTRVTAGADTHRDQHVVAALDERGGELGVRSFPTTAAGYPRCSPGYGNGVRSSVLASKEPVAMEPD